MSADNGIFILQTYGPEYRVVHAQAIENVYGKFDETTNHWKGDPETLLSYFGKSKVFTDVVEAYDYAENMSKDYEFLEYGISLIRDWENRKFKDMVDG